MLVTGVPFWEFRRIASEVSAQYGGNVEVKNYTILNNQETRYRVSLCTLDSDARGSRRSWNGRRMRAVCWHAFRDVFRAVLTAYPSGRIQTAMAVYKGLEGFEDNYPATGETNVGSMASHVTMPELCSCDGSTPTVARTTTRTVPSTWEDTVRKIDTTLDWVDNRQSVYRDSTGEEFYAMPTR